MPPPAITFLTQDEVRRLFAVITGKRDRARFQLAYHYRLRASEVSLLQREDVHAKQGRSYIPRVQGSIAKTYPLQPEDLRLVRAYLRTREVASPYLFISARGIPLERRSYWDLMQKYGQVAARTRCTTVSEATLRRVEDALKVATELPKMCRGNMPGRRRQRITTAVAPSGGSQPPADRIAHEGRRLMNVQLPHQVDAMRLDGFHAQPQVRCDLLRRLPFRDPLDDLALA
jgi:hypothetical protein